MLEVAGVRVGVEGGRGAVERDGDALHPSGRPAAGVGDPDVDREHATEENQTGPHRGQPGDGPDVLQCRAGRR